MKCEFEEDLTAYVDGELPEPRAKEISRHLAGCAECRTIESLVRKTAEVMTTLPSFEPSPALRRAVLTGLHPPPGRWDGLARLFRPQLLLPLLGALALGGVVLAVGSGPGKLEVTEPSQLELAMSLELVEDLDVVGVESADDLDVISELHELGAPGAGEESR